MTILVTGAAGFIGYHVCERLLARGEEVIGVDNLNSYYDVSLKQARLERLLQQAKFRFCRLDISDRDGVSSLFAGEGSDAVIHLAAQAGVRYSLQNPHAYVDANLVGFVNVLEGCRHSGTRHLVYASSSSVYGANTKVPFSTKDSVDHPVSLYAATKKANELLAYSYSHLYRLPMTGLRFFTVYGPWGRPDMAYYLFTDAILAGRPIDLFNYGQARRDFTYIDDIVEGVIRVLDHPPTSGEAKDAAPHRVFNIGNNCPVDLLRFIEVLERCLGINAEKRLLPPQLGDVAVTFADIDDLVDAVGFRPKTGLEDGLSRFVEWYRSYHRIPTRTVAA